MYSVLEGSLIIANSVELDEMQHYAAFHLGLHYLPKYPLKGGRCFFSGTTDHVLGL